MNFGQAVPARAGPVSLRRFADQGTSLGGRSASKASSARQAEGCSSEADGVLVPPVADRGLGLADPACGGGPGLQVVIGMRTLTL